MESHVQRSIQKWVSERGGKVEKIHGSEFSEKGSPDLLGSIPMQAVIPDTEGFVHFRIETKGVGKASKIQLYRLEQWAEQGFWTAVVYSLDEFISKLEEECHDRIKT